MIQLHHAISLALIYINRATYGSANMITLEQSKEYQSIVNNNLKEMKSKIRDLTPPDCCITMDELFFSFAEDINREGYYILKDDYESLEKRKRYIMHLPLDVVLASQKNNALEVLDLVMIDGKIIKKDKSKIKKILK